MKALATYLRADEARVAMALCRLALNGPSAIELQPGVWITVLKRETPAVVKRGKVLQMVKQA